MVPDEIGETSVYEKRMKLRYAGVCRLCGVAIAARVEAIYERTLKTVRCIQCPDPANSPAGPALAAGFHLADESPAVGETPEDPSSPPEDSPPGTAESQAVPVQSEPPVSPDSTSPALPDDASVAGASARREYERRRAKDEARIRDRWGRLGGVAVFLAEEKQSTRAWAQGAAGEAELGRHLAGIASKDVIVLHDRRIPRSRANIDHIVIAPTGVWVIDAKRYKGIIRKRVEGGIIRPRSELLIVTGRNRTKLVDGVLKQMDLVKAVVGDVPVEGVLCFLDPDWPFFGGPFVTRGVHVRGPKRLKKKITAPTENPIDVGRVSLLISEHFKAM